MNKWLIIFLLMVSCRIDAQETIGSVYAFDAEDRAELLSDSVVAMRPFLSLPPLSYRGTLAYYPFSSPFFTGLNSWQLHAGVNASLSMAGIFSHRGSGFSNTASLMYADTLTSRLSFAVGGYLSRLDWRGRAFTDAGLTALLNYRIDEHLEASLFVQKSILPEKRFIPLPLVLREDIGDRIGAEIRYHFSPVFSMGVSVWCQQSTVPPGAFGR
ncbi:MAG: hypothetical protein IJV24_08530 [Prevotella sp.]|nr:hypothetical protein [Prevotella sp.]